MASKGLVEAGRRTRSKTDGEVPSAHRPPFPRSRLHLRWRNARTFFFLPRLAGSAEEKRISAALCWRQRTGTNPACARGLLPVPACTASPPRKGIPPSCRGQKAVRGRMLEAHPLTLTLAVTRAAHLVFKHRTGSFMGNRLLEPVSL